MTELPLLTDFHSHILPGIDDGARKSEDSIAALKKAASCGIGQVVFTPHFYPHRQNPKEFLSRREASYRRLFEKTDGFRALPAVYRGAEVLAFAGLDRMEGFRSLLIEGTDILLLELPFSAAEHTEELFETIERILNRHRLTVLLAHPHRYEEKSILRALTLGARLQLNAEDAASFFQRRRTEAFLATGAVAALGSDMHRDLRVYDRWTKAAKHLRGRMAPLALPSLPQTETTEKEEEERKEP